jgi:hypothetical protein
MEIGEESMRSIMARSAPEFKQMLTSDKQAAHVLNVHPASVRRMGDQGKLERVKVLNKTQYTVASVYRAADPEEKQAEEKAEEKAEEEAEAEAEAEAEERKRTRPWGGGTRS